ncbi:MAG: alpha/beta hydrolase [Rhizobiaceae bacterium]|nr:alpha/beta hydrolase [Rhizobiaceae bacterium]
MTDKTSMQHSKISIGNIELDYLQGGEGPTLLYLHGINGLEASRDALEALAAHFRVIAPVHPGFGDADMPLEMDSIDDIVHLYIALLRKLRPNHVILVGVSVGGWIAAELASKLIGVVDRLILVSPVGIKVGPVDRLDIPDIFAITEAELRRRIYHDPARHDFNPEAFEDRELLAVARRRETLALITWEPYMHNPKLKDRLRHIEAPALVVRGASDELVSDDYARAFSDRIPGARIVEIAGAGHLPDEEQAVRLADQIVEFAGKQEAMA